MAQATEQDELDQITTTATHVFTLRQMTWIRREAKRRSVSMSEVVREAVTQAMAHPEKEAA